MIDIRMRVKPLSYWQKWFYHAPSRFDAPRLVWYKQAQRSVPVPGFVCRPYPTLLLDIAKGPDALWKGFGKTPRYEIHRARREGVSFAVDNDPAKFVSVYNAFAATKGLAELSAAAFGCYAPFLCNTYAVREGEALVAHSYLLDREFGRARLLYSASLFRKAEGNEERQFFGRANRFLHYEDMLCFRQQGIRSVDLAGYWPDTSDPVLRGISAFKESFGGVAVEEHHYFSIPLYLYRIIMGRLAGREI